MQSTHDQPDAQVKALAVLRQRQKELTVSLNTYRELIETHKRRLARLEHERDDIQSIIDTLKGLQT